MSAHLRVACACVHKLEVLLIALILNGVQTLSIVCLGICVTCFIPSVHDVEHTVPVTGDVSVGYVVCITTFLCMYKISDKM